MNEFIRKPVVAGQFYPSTKEKLLKQIEQFVEKKAKKEKAFGCVLPHAGYMYSGSVAGQTVSYLEIPDNVLLLGPNHTGAGSLFSVMSSGRWQTPLGEIEINDSLAENLLKNSKHLEADIEAHKDEHSIEVELPFLQYFRSDFKFVPIVVSQADLATYRLVAKEIANSLKELKIDDKILIVASSDMTHYEPLELAQKKDKKAIDAILELDEGKLIGMIEEFGISMCGYAPVVIMLAVTKELGAKYAHLVKYQTSGDVTGDYSSVVGYAGIIIK